MAQETGMDVEAVRIVAVKLDEQAARVASIVAEIEGSVAAIEQNWTGADAQLFAGWWHQQHRSDLMRASDAIAGLAQSARNNVSEQEQVSGGTSGAGPGLGGLAVGGGAVGAGGVAAIGSTLRTASDVGSPFGTLASTLGDTKGIPVATGIGKSVSLFGYAVDGYTIGEDLANGNYRAAGLETAFAGADITADAMKSTGTPLGYGGGVAVQAWTEVGREARNVDWSMKGLQDIQQASLGDWAGGLGYAAQQMPLKLVKIFGF